MAIRDPIFKIFRRSIPSAPLQAGASQAIFVSASLEISKTRTAYAQVRASICMTCNFSHQMFSIKCSPTTTIERQSLKFYFKKLDYYK